jgi:hypothetical protein
MLATHSLPLPRLRKIRSHTSSAPKHYPWRIAGPLHLLRGATSVQSPATTFKIIEKVRIISYLVLHVKSGPQVADGGDGLQIWMVGENILNKQSRTADRGWSYSLGVGRRGNDPTP